MQEYYEEYIIALFCGNIEGERIVKEIVVYKGSMLEETVVERIINDDRKKDITHLNEYKGNAYVRCYFDGELQYGGSFVEALFNECGNARINFLEEERYV